MDFFVAVLTMCAMYRGNPGPSRATEHGGCAEGSQLELVRDDEHNGEPLNVVFWEVIYPFFDRDSPSYSEKDSSDESSCCVEDSSSGASACIVGPKVSLLGKCVLYIHCMYVILPL